MFANFRQFARSLIAASHDDFAVRADSNIRAKKAERDLIRNSLRWNKM